MHPACYTIDSYSEQFYSNTHPMQLKSWARFPTVVSIRPQYNIAIFAPYYSIFTSNITHYYHLTNILHSNLNAKDNIHQHESSYSSIVLILDLLLVYTVWSIWQSYNDLLGSTFVRNDNKLSSGSLQQIE